MKKLWDILKREDDYLSLGRICAVISFLMWMLVTVYLVVFNKSWMHYDTLTIAAVCNLLVQVANKAVECKLFSIKENKDDC